MDFCHQPVMLNECMDALHLCANGIYFDGTLGGGGHTAEILKRTSPSGKVIATDLDQEAISSTEIKLKQYQGRFQLVHGNFKDMPRILSEHNMESVQGILLDLGVSSYQLDNFDRGFSYRAEQAHLDMRMNAACGQTAYEIVNNYSEDTLMKIFFEYGEERFSKRIAANIVQARSVQPIVTCGELVQIIVSSIPAAARRTGGNPAKRVFQALRIEVNNELVGLQQAIMQLTSKLSSGGRICVITFHSLEDRIVKHAFKYLESDCICDKSAPICTCNKKREIKIITSKPITACAEELQTNRRSSSAKLRVAEKL